jgi:hypothetical protein
MAEATMQDGPAIATLIMFVAIFATYGLLSRLGRRALRRASTALLTDHLVHWRYPPGAWSNYCEQLRRELWVGTLRPATRYLLPLLLVGGAVGLVAALRAGVSAGLAALLVVTVALLVTHVLIGAPLHSFFLLSRRCRFDYELYLGADGAVEVWYDASGVRATEARPFTAGAARIERVEAHGIDPTEIVFTLVRPLAYGFLHGEERFLVPAGQLAAARDLAHRLTPAAAEHEADDDT